MPASARAAEGAQPRVLSPQEARQWWARMQRGAADRGYQGVLTMSVGGLVRTTRIDHGVDASGETHRLEALDGKPRMQWRRASMVTTLWPQARVATLEADDAVVEFPLLPRADPQRMVERYVLSLLGRDRVAGVDAMVLAVQPRDGWRFAQRLWVEPATGLLLRAEVLGSQGELLESSGFSELRWLPARRDLAPPASAPEGWRVLKHPSLRSDLAREGWQLQRDPPGFELLRVVRRPLPTSGSDANDVRTAPAVVQAVYTDGLVQVSLFAEPFDPARHKGQVRSRMGATRSLMVRHGDHWVTVVGEVPAPTIEWFEDAFQRR